MRGELFQTLKSSKNVEKRFFDATLTRKCKEQSKNVVKAQSLLETWNWNLLFEQTVIWRRSNDFTRFGVDNEFFEPTNSNFL